MVIPSVLYKRHEQLSTPGTGLASSRTVQPVRYQEPDTLAMYLSISSRVCGDLVYQMIRLSPLLMGEGEGLALIIAQVCDEHTGLRARHLPRD